MDELERLRGKIDRQRVELANLRKKRERVAVTELKTLKAEIESYRGDHRKIADLERDIRSLVADNEQLKRENAELREVNRRQCEEIRRLNRLGRGVVETTGGFWD